MKRKLLKTVLSVILVGSIIGAIVLVTYDNDANVTETTETTETVEAEKPDVTLGQTLLGVFKESLEMNPNMAPQELATVLIEDESILFEGAIAPVKPGYLAGFKEEITGFEEGVNFAPMIGTIPFTGYVFRLAEDANVEAFIETLNANADLRWNICTEADELVIDIAPDNKLVFCVLAPFSLSE